MGLLTRLFGKSENQEELIAARLLVVGKSVTGKEHLADEAFREFISEYPHDHVQKCEVEECTDGAVYSLFVVCRPEDVPKAQRSLNKKLRRRGLF